MPQCLAVTGPITIGGSLLPPARCRREVDHEGDHAFDGPYAAFDAGVRFGEDVRRYMAIIERLRRLDDDDLDFVGRFLDRLIAR